MLQAYIDESCKDGAFVMAGYVASAESWLAFADEWASLLALSRPHWRSIDEFHQNEMTSPLGLEQSELFYRVIEHHLDMQVSCTIRLSDLQEAFGKLIWPDWAFGHRSLVNEHFMAFDTIVRMLALEQSRLGLNEPIDTIFDNHSNKGRCVEAWDRMKRSGHPRIRRLLGGAPTFKDSASALPLQAADLLAYWVRDSQQQPGSSQSSFRMNFPWKAKKNIKGVHVFFEPDAILRNFQKAHLAMQLARYSVPAACISAALSP
jgi:hypothetical protein